MSIDTYAAVYALTPFELLANNDFTSGLTGWEDVSGSWTLAGGGGVEYDNDGEFNPLTTSYDASSPLWVRFQVNTSVGATGTLLVEVRNSLGVPIYNSDTAENYIYLDVDVYTFAVIADDFVGTLDSVSLRIAVYRPPTPDEPDIELGAEEFLTNPIFATDLSGWTDATGSWSWDVHVGAEYDNDGEGNYLTQDVALETGWYRLGVQLVDGSTVVGLYVDVDGIPESFISYEGDFRESYFFIDTDDTYTVRVQAIDLDGYVSQVTLTEALQRKPNASVSKTVRGVVVVAYDMRAAYDVAEDVASVMIGRGAGLYAFYASGSVAIGEFSLINGGDNSVAIGFSARMKRGLGNVAIGSQSQRDATGDMNVSIGQNSALNNEGDRNVIIGQQAGMDAATNRSVIIGNRAGEEETSDDKLHVANTNTESLIKGDFVARTLAVGFDDLSDGTATLDLAAYTDRPSLRARGGVQLARKTVTAAYTATLADHILFGDANGGAFSITLPAASGNDGLVYRVKKVDSSGNAVTIDGNGSETIDGSTTKVLAAQYDTVEIVCDGSNWFVI